MIKIDKKLLTTYLALGSKKADTYLAKLAAEMQEEAAVSSDNDRIFEILDLLEEFVYKVPERAIEIVESILQRRLEPKLIESPMGSFYGKSHTDVAIKALELLDRIRYIRPDAVLSLLAEIIRSGEKEQKSKATEILKHFAKYDFNVLTKSKIGYGAQGKALDYILAWSRQDRIANFDFVEIVTHELLGSSVEGATAESMDTFAIHFGAVQPNEDLKKIRLETIDLIFDLYQHIADEEKKVRLVKVLEEALRTPINVAYGEDLAEMIADDAEHLLAIYRRMLFDKEGRLVGSIPIAEEIEKRLYWFHRSGKLNTPEAKQLRRDILADPFYSLFRLFAGDDITLMEEEGWDEAESNRSKEIDAKVEELKDSNLNDWINTLDRVAEQVGMIAEWQFRHFKIFLRRLAMRKPDIAATIVDDALSNNKSMKNFAAYIFDGLRDVRRLDLWDAAVSEIIDKRDPALVSAIAYSLNLDKKDVDLSKEVREEDLLLLEDIVKCSGRFAFLAEHKESNWALQHAVISALTRNFRRDPTHIETLILEMLHRHPERKEFIVRELEFGININWIDCGQFSKEGINSLKTLLVELEDLDWDVQGLLLNLGKKDVRIIFDVFWSRIKRDATRKKKKRVLDEPEHYRAVPYHLNDKLKKYLSEHPQFQTLIGEWLKKVTPEWSPYNWNVSQFLKEMGSSFTTVLRALIESGNETSLRKAVQLMHRFEGSDIELCVEVVRRTKNKKIINEIGGLLYSTGVVSGEDGIARAYEAKAEILGKYLSDDSDQVREFAVRMIKSFEDSAKKERQAAKERKQLRKIEFEG